MQEKQKKAIRWISPVLIALTALIVWRVNYEIEFMMDDEWYSTVLDPESQRHYPCADLALF